MYTGNRGQGASGVPLPSVAPHLSCIAEHEDAAAQDAAPAGRRCAVRLRCPQTEREREPHTYSCPHESLGSPVQQKQSSSATAHTCDVFVGHDHCSLAIPECLGHRGSRTHWHRPRCHPTPLTFQRVCRRAWQALGGLRTPTADPVPWCTPQSTCAVHTQKRRAVQFLDFTTRLLSFHCSTSR
jgi:hypothetical protein